MASLRKRTYKSGKTSWVIDYYKGNKHLMKTIGNCDKRSAEMILHKFISNQSKEEVGVFELKKITLKKLQNEYLKYSQSIRARATVEREKQILKTLLSHCGDIYISDLSLNDLEKYQERRSHIVSKETVNLEFRHLKAIFNWAKEKNYISHNVFLKIKPIRTPESDLPKFFEINDIQKIRKLFKDDPFEFIVEFYILTGARLKEALVLKWENIDQIRRIIKIPSISTKAKKHRLISYSHDTKLKNLLKEIPKREDNLLFGPVNAKQWSAWWVSRRISKKLGGIGFTWASCHTFRHTYISHLVMKGVPLTTVKEVVGHSSFTTTLKYAHLSNDHKDQMVLKRPY